MSSEYSAADPATSPTTPTTPRPLESGPLTPPGWPDDRRLRPGPDLGRGDRRGHHRWCVLRVLHIHHDRPAPAVACAEHRGDECDQQGGTQPAVHAGAVRNGDRVRGA